MKRLTASIPDALLPRRFRRRRAWYEHWYVYAACAIGGAIVMFIADPQVGRRRRAKAKDRSLGAVHHSERRVSKSLKRYGATISGEAKGLRHARSQPEPVANDQMLADRVMSQAFRDRDLDRSRVNLNVEDGVVVLHGVLDDQKKIDRLNKKIRKVPGVKDVANYLHPPDKAAPQEGQRHNADGSPFHTHD
jgi:hypothetical protein